MNAPAKVDVLVVLNAEISSINSIRCELGEAVTQAEDKGEYVHRAPDDLTLSDLNHAVIQLRKARTAVTELIAERDALGKWQREVVPLLAAAKSWMPSRKCAAHIREIDAALDCVKELGA